MICLNALSTVDKLTPSFAKSKKNIFSVLFKQLNARIVVAGKKKIGQKELMIVVKKMQRRVCHAVRVKVIVMMMMIVQKV